MMTRIKKLMAVLLTAAMVTGGLSGCGSAQKETPEAPSDSENTEGQAQESTSELEAIEIVLPAAAPAENIEIQYTEKWMDMVTERTGGKVTFDYTNGGALGGFNDLIDGVNNGAYDMTVTDIGQLPRYVPEMELVGLPFLLKDYDHMEAVFSSDIFTWLQDCIEKESNMKLLNAYFTGFRDILSVDELKTIDDFQGYLIRSPQVEAYTKMVSTLGFSYTTLDWNECYSAMQTGVIDAVETTLAGMYKSGFCDLGKYVLITNHIGAVNGLVVNQDFWASLPEEYKTIMMEAIEEINDSERKQCVEEEEECKSQMKEAGVTINELSAEDQERINELFKPYWSEVAERIGGNSQEMIDKILSLAK